MAIAEILTALGENNAPRLTELGKIKIGGLGEARPKIGGGGTWRLPQKHDYFTITTLNRNQGGDLVADKKLMDQLLADYGDQDGKLRQIPVRVLSDDIDEVLQSAFVWYGGKTVGARSDGKTITWNCCPELGKYFGTRYPEPVEQPWTPECLELKDTKGNKLFKLHSVFNCVVAAQESRFGGVYKLRTTSIISFKQLYASLLHIHQLTGGILIGMPIVLVVRPVQVSPDGKTTTVYVVHAELRGSGLAELQAQAVNQMQFRLENRQRLASAQNQYRKLLAAPGTESQSEAEDISAEFHPEMEAPEAAPEKYSILDDDAEVIPTAQTNPTGGADTPTPLPSPPPAQAVATTAPGSVEVKRKGRPPAVKEAAPVSPVAPTTPVESLPPQTPMEAILDPSEPVRPMTKEEEIAAEVDEATPEILRGFIKAKKLPASATFAIANECIEKHRPQGQFIDDFSPETLRAVALDLKLALLKR